jgi:hypothetical protein
VISGAAKGDKGAGNQIAKPIVERMTPKDQEICNKYNICKWHAVCGDCKFGTKCRNQHMSEVERKAKGLSFTVSSEKEDMPAGSSENDVLVDLLNEECTLTNAERINPGHNADGQAFHGQFGGLGFFAIGVNTEITDEIEQIVFDVDTEYNDPESYADDMRTTMSADDMNFPLDADAMNDDDAMNDADALDADDMIIVLDADEMREEAVEEYNAVEAYADRLEAQGSKCNKKIRRDSLPKMKKRADKKQQKQQTLRMREERREFTAGGVMAEVDHDIIHTAMDDNNVAEDRMPAEITMPEQQNVIVEVLDMLVGKMSWGFMVYGEYPRDIPEV